MKRILQLVLLSLLLLADTSVGQEAGTFPLLEGNGLAGWKFVGSSNRGLVATNRTLTFTEATLGSLFTEAQFENFVLRFEFKPGTNAAGAVAIRAPFYGDAAAFGLKIALGDDVGPRSAGLRPDHFTGSLVDIAPARRGSFRPNGEWNAVEIRMEGRWLSVALNDRDILTVNLSDQRSPEMLASHPGVLRTGGHIGFIGQGSRMAYRNIQMTKLPSSFVRDNAPPYPGFFSLYNGVNLTGWKGRLKEPNDNPSNRARLPAIKLKQAQTEADALMGQHWKSSEGVLSFDGKGDGLSSTDDYENFELFLDWKIADGATAGVFLRGCPLVQICDPFRPGTPATAVGSGGLRNNLKGASKPTSLADASIGKWNRFHILMLGDRVTVFLNGELVTHNIIFENAWDRLAPLPASGPIELQVGANPMSFRNVSLRPL